MIYILLISLISSGNLHCSDIYCSSCIQGLTYASVACVQLCPEGSSHSLSQCKIFSYSPFIQITFYEILEYSISIVGNFSHPLNLPLNDTSRASPIPTKERGFYFQSTSSLLSNINWVLGPIFYFNTLVRLVAEGQIFQVANANFTYFSINYSNSKLVSQVTLDTNTGKLVQESQGTVNVHTWVTISFSCQLTLGQTQISLGTAKNIILNAELVTVPGLIFTIGGSFTGFIYELFMGNVVNPGYSPMISAPLCTFNQFYDNDLQVCTDCPSNCPTWPWCTRASCSICLSFNCTECVGLSFMDCVTCGNSLQAPYCDFPLNCNAGGLFSCTQCDSGYLNIGGICINSPYMYSSSSPAPVINVKFEQFAQFYGGIFQSGENANTYAPFVNPDSDDPFPVYSRGVYFNSTTKLKSLGLISMNYDFSIAFWIYFVGSETFLVMYSENLQVLTYMKSFITLKTQEENRVFFTMVSLSLEAKWNMVYLAGEFQQPYQSVKVGTQNGVQGAFSVAGYVFYDTPNQMSIGAKNGYAYSGFMGFIYQFILWQRTVLDFSQFFGPCSDGTSSCLSGMGVLDYWNAYEHQAMSCELECGDGCRTWGTCDQCQSVLCQTCTDYNASCTVGQQDFCLSGFYLTENGKCCDDKCFDCYGPGYYRCLQCSIGWVLNGNVCVDSCPSFFQLVSEVCGINQTLVIELDFDVISEAVADKCNSIVFYTASNSSIWPHTNESDPIPAYQRGYYFSSESYMNSEYFSLSYNFSAVFYLKIIQPGTLLAKNSLKILTSNTGYSLDINTTVLSTGSEAFNIWMVVIFQIYSNIDGNLFFSILTTSSQTISSSSYPFIISDSNSSMTLGNSNGSFVGFIWMLQIYFSIEPLTSQSLTVCNYNGETNCVWDCSISQALYGSSCESCLQICSFGCKDPNFCGLCSSSICVSCTSYSSCGSCPDHSAAFESSCKCLDGYQKQGESCLKCEKYFLENICLEECPVGYISVGFNCSQKLDSGLAVSFLFDTPGIEYVDSTAGLGSSCVNLTPAYMRGVYFNGTDSYLAFPRVPNTDLLFGLRFFICTWLFSTTSSGAVLTKYNADQILFNLSLSDSYVSSFIFLSSSTLSLFSNTIIKNSTWYFLMLSLEYTGSSSFSLYINGNKDCSNNIEDIFVDIIGGTLQLGSTISDLFEGFVYSLYTYVQFPVINTLFSLSCDSCSVCPDSSGCIPNCSISTYYSTSTNTCESCLESCSQGCRHTSNCSLCSDSECETCSTYELNSCTQCKPGFIVTESICGLCDSGLFFDYSLKSCVNCKGLCETCESGSVCLTCKNISSLNTSQICECDLGYYGTEECVRRMFDSMLTVDSNNNVFLLFTEDLMKDLNVSVLNVMVEQDEVFFTLSKIDGFTYEIQLGDVPILQYNKLYVYFLEEIISTQNSLLDKKFVSISLYSQTPQQISQSLQVLKQSTKSIIMGSVGGLLGVSLISFDPNCLYTFLNSAELYTFTLLYEIDLDPDLQDFLLSVQVTSNLPSLFTFISLDYQNMTDDKLNNYGFSTNMVFLNSGFFLTVFLALATINMVFYMLPIKGQGRFSNFLRKCYSYFKFNIYLRFWIQTLFELFIGSIIGIKFASFQDLSQIFNFVLCVMILIGQVLGLSLLFYSIYKKSVSINLHTDEEILSKFGVFFEEFSEEHPSKWLFYCLFSLRRMIISALIMFLPYGMLQISASVVLSLCVIVKQVIIYVCYTNCFVDKQFQIYFLWCETLVLVFYLQLALCIDPKIGGNKKMTYIGICNVMLVLGATVILSIAGLVKRIRGYCYKGIKTAAIDEVTPFPMVGRKDLVKFFK